MRKIKIYLSARISKDAHKWNDKVCCNLKDPIKIFMPQKHNPWSLSHKEFPIEVYETDILAMKESDICLVLPEYGRDCAWEVGWYSGSKKPIVVFVENQLDWLRDWMVKGSINYVITSNQHTWKRLIQDPILKSKPIIFIENLNQLNEEIIRIFNKTFGEKNG